MKMNKPIFVYHGSGKKLIGNKLVPKKANDVDKKKIHNSQKGVYASGLRKEAIIMGILKSNGVRSSSVHVKGKRKIDAIIYTGWPKEDYFYLYTLPSKTFKESPKGSSQWVSSKAINPLKIQRLPVKKYIHWIRKATKKEKQNWIKEFGELK